MKKKKKGTVEHKLRDRAITKQVQQPLIAGRKKKKKP